MAEPDLFKFTYQELAELMIRQLGISEGLWMIYMRFGIAAANAGAGPEDLRPTAIVPVLEIGLQRADEPSNLTVDASTVSKTTPRRRARKEAKPSEKISAHP